MQNHWVRFSLETHLKIQTSALKTEKKLKIKDWNREKKKLKFAALNRQFDQDKYKHWKI